ncbi:MAG: sugar-transfer associated ATP-grasp domain-containing protein [Eubacteriales bacterium]|nr:sugar-transfer associated ATP-grasp domain-containing protein [Eubacteriales bacterium]
MKRNFRFIPINNRTYLKLVYSIAGVLKELSYKYAVRKKAGFKRFKRDKNFRDGIKKYYSQYGIKRLDYYWHDFYREVSGVDSVKFIPDYIFYRYIEPQNSELELAKAYADKNLYQTRFGDLVKTPKCLLRNMNGVFYNLDHEEISRDQALDVLSSISEKHIIKPSLLSGGGRDIALIEKKDKALYLGTEVVVADKLFKRYGDNFCIQDIIRQDPMMAKFNPDSVNSIKILTARMDGDIIFVDSYVRIGLKGTITDNFGTGGIYCGVDKSGLLKSYAYGEYPNRYYSHPDTGVKFEGTRYPGFDQIVEKSLLLHKRLPYFRFATWDMTFDNTGEAVLIEVNLSHQDVSGYQLQNGPVFGDYTDRILADTFL